MDVYRLEEIIEVDIPGVSQRQCEHHLEACIVCFDHNDHYQGTDLKIKDSGEEIVRLEWAETIDDRIRTSWKDIQEATEYGATALAILLIIKRTNYTISSRSAKGNGFDYWLQETDNFDPNILGTARLEVSGIIKANKNNEISSRVNQKKKQISVSNSTNLPVVIVVVEFSHPEAHMVHI